MERIRGYRKILAACLSAVLGINSISAYSSDFGSQKVHLRNFVSTLEKHKKKIGVVLASALILFSSRQRSRRHSLTGNQWFEFLGGKQKDIENYKQYSKDPHVANILMREKGYKESASWKELDLETVDLDVPRSSLFGKTEEKLLERILKTHCLKTSTHYTQGFNLFCGMVIRKFLGSNHKNIDIDTEAKIYYVYDKIVKVLTSQEWFLENTFDVDKMRQNTKDLLIKYDMYHNLPLFLQSMDNYYAAFGKEVLGILDDCFKFDELMNIWDNIIRSHSKNREFDSKAAYEDLFCSFNLKFLAKSKIYLNKEGKRGFDNSWEILEFAKNLKDY